MESYNKAAKALIPPRRTLQWSEVVEYAFLADFDLLRDTRQDIQLRPWAKPAARMAMDMYFKTQRAKEEIRRLNIEIRRVITYIRDEDIFLRAQESAVRLTDPLLAHQIHLYQNERGRFNEAHMQCFRATAKLHGFSGSLHPGTAITAGSAPPPQTTPVPHSQPDIDPAHADVMLIDSSPAAQPYHSSLPPPPSRLSRDLQDLDDEEAEEEEEVELWHDLESILSLSKD